MHEVGHCFGLFHTFTDPNAPLPPQFLTNDHDELQEQQGDGIKDTPVQSEPTYGNTLISSSNADIAFINTMNYIQDASSLGFTHEQVQRLRYFLQHDVKSYINDIETGSSEFVDEPSSVVLVDRTTSQDNSTDQTWLIVMLVVLIVIFVLIVISSTKK